MSDDLIERLRARKVFNGNTTIRRDGSGGPWVEERQTETDTLCDQAAAALTEAQATIARLESALQGIADATDLYEPCGWAVHRARAALSPGKGE